MKTTEYQQLAPAFNCVCMIAITTYLAYVTRTHQSMQSLCGSLKPLLLLRATITASVLYLVSFFYFNLILGQYENQLVTVTQMSCNFAIFTVGALTKSQCDNYIKNCKHEDKTKLELSLTYESLELYPLSD